MKERDLLKQPVKDDYIRFRLPDYEKKQFQKICESLDSDTSRELRLMIRDFIKKHRQGELKL